MKFFQKRSSKKRFLSLRVRMVILIHLELLFCIAFAFFD